MTKHTLQMGDNSNLISSKAKTVFKQFGDEPRSQPARQYGEGSHKEAKSSNVAPYTSSSMTQQFG